MPDPEISCTPKGAPARSFTVASNCYLRQNEELQEEVSCFDATVWNRLAEVCKEYLGKGRGVRVVGRLKQDRWEDPEGKTRSKVHIVAEHVESKPMPGEKAANGANAAQTPAREEAELKEAASF